MDLGVEREGRASKKRDGVCNWHSFCSTRSAEPPGGGENYNLA